MSAHATTETRPSVLGQMQLREARKRKFLRSLEQHGGNISQTARDTKINRRNHQRWCTDDPEYAALAAEAIEVGVDGLEAEARRRAVDGVQKPVYYQGEHVGFVREYSDTLLIFLLKAARPEKYRESKIDEEFVKRAIERELARVAGLGASSVFEQAQGNA